MDTMPWMTASYVALGDWLPALQQTSTLVLSAKTAQTTMGIPILALPRSKGCHPRHAAARGYASRPSPPAARPPISRSSPSTLGSVRARAAPACCRRDGAAGCAAPGLLRRPRAPDAWCATSTDTFPRPAGWRIRPWGHVEEALAVQHREHGFVFIGRQRPGPK